MLAPAPIAVGKGKECTAGVSGAHVKVPAAAYMALPCCGSSGRGVPGILSQGLITTSLALEEVPE